MKILHVTPSYLPAIRYGGPIWSVHGLAKAQASLGHHVEVYTTSINGSSDSDVPLGKKVDVDGIDVTYFGSKKLRRIFWAPEMAHALKANVSNFDIVHTHSVFLWPTTAGAREAYRQNIPYIVSPRGMLWREVINERSKWIKRLWIIAFERTNIKRAHAVHVTADLEAQKIKNLGLQLQRTICLPNAVEPPVKSNLNTISPDVKQAISKGPYLLSLGRLSWKKNNIALIRALSLVPNIRLIIAGNEEDNHAQILRDEVDKLDLTERVDILSRQITGHDKEALFLKSVSFVLPSLSENMGNTVLEAMIRGRAVIVSRQAGVMEVVAKYECGYLCNPEPQSIAAKIDTLLKNPDQTKEMAKRGKKAALTAFNWPRIAQEMCQAYTQNI